MGRGCLRYAASATCQVTSQLAYSRVINAAILLPCKTSYAFIQFNHYVTIFVNQTAFF